MKTPKLLQKGFTLIELLVVIAIIAILASLAVPAITGALVKGQLAQTVNNGRQIQIATFSMATDATTTGDAKLGWPGDLFESEASGAKVQNVQGFLKRLMDYEYLKEGDMMKVIQAPGMQPWQGGGTPINAQKNCAFKVYKTKDGDGASTIFLATQNFSYGSALDATKVPYKDKGFVVVRKGGDAAAYKPNQYDSKEILGLLPGRTSYTDAGQESDQDVLPQS